MLRPETCWHRGVRKERSILKLHCDRSCPPLARVITVKSSRSVSRCNSDKTGSNFQSEVLFAADSSCDPADLYGFMTQLKIPQPRQTRASSLDRPVSLPYSG